MRSVGILRRCIVSGPVSGEGWFTPFKIGPMFGTADLYAINDGHYTGSEAVLRNFQKGKKSKKIWKGTLEQALEMCALLNRDQKVMRKATTGVTSDTQKRYYSNRPRTTKPTMSAFKKCECGAMYKGDKHCD